MARSRPALESAINEILRKHGVEGKRMSYRQAERVTGLSPATVGELAKGNARTPETIRRFAVGLGEDPNRLMLLAGFVPEEAMRPTEDDLPTTQSADALSTDKTHPTPRRTESPSRPTEHTPSSLTGPLSDNVVNEIEPDEREWLGRFGRALAKMPPGRERDLWKDSLRRDTELLESFLARLNPPTANFDEQRFDTERTDREGTNKEERTNKETTDGKA